MAKFISVAAGAFFFACVMVALTLLSHHNRQRDIAHESKKDSVNKYLIFHHVPYGISVVPYGNREYVVVRAVGGVAVCPVTEDGLVYGPLQDTSSDD